jgi:hypothetical protein
LLLASGSIASAQGTDSIPDCSPLPKILRFTQPLYPPNVEPRGLPNPVSMVVEFTVTPEGRATQVLAVESDAGAYAREFREQAVQAMATVRFHRIPMSCRGRMKIAFKLAD